MSDQVLTMLGEITGFHEEINGVAMVDGKGAVLYQTENWDLRNDAPGLISAWATSQGSISVLGIRYVIVENTPERLIATNVTGKGHVIAVSSGPNKIIVYISPAIGPTIVLNDIFLHAMKIGKLF